MANQAVGTQGHSLSNERGLSIGQPGERGARSWRGRNPDLGHSLNKARPGARPPVHPVGTATEGQLWYDQRVPGPWRVPRPS